MSKVKACKTRPFKTVEDGEAIFDANDAIGSGVLEVSVSHSSVPCPVYFCFTRGANVKHSFAMDRQAARKLIIHLLKEGV